MGGTVNPSVVIDQKKGGKVGRSQHASRTFRSLTKEEVRLEGWFLTGEDGGVMAYLRLPLRVLLTQVCSMVRPGQGVEMGKVRSTGWV